MHWQSLGICCQQWEPKADRQTDRTARTPSVPATPSLTHGAFGNQQGRSCAPWRTTTRIDPPAAAHSPGAFQASIPRVFRTRWGGDRRRSAADAAQPPRPPCPGTTIACRSLSATWEAAGGDPAGKGSSQLQALAEHQRHPNPQPGIPSLPRPGCCKLPVLGEFFFQAGKKILVGLQQPPLQAQKAAGIGSEPPPRDVGWDGDADRETGIPRGDQGCWECQKQQSRAMSRAGAAVLGA